MADKYSTEQFQKDAARWFEEGLSKIPRPDKAVADQAALLRNFQEQVTKQVTETRSILDSAKAFLKDPKGEGTKIVKDGLKAADSFFSSIFKTLTKDVGEAVKTILSGIIDKIKANLKSSFGTQYTQVTKWLTTQFKNANTALFKLGVQLERSTNKSLQPLGKSITGLSNSFNKVLVNWGRSSGLQKAFSQIATIGTSITKNSQALAALKEVPKAMGTLVKFVALIGKAAPLISSFVDLYWKNDVTNKLKSLEREARLQDGLITRNHTAVFTKLKQIEAQLMALKKHILEMVQAETTPSDTLNEQDTTTAKSPNQD